MKAQDWFAYLDDFASQNENSPVAKHLQSCCTCRETVERMRSVDTSLLRAAASLRASVRVSSYAVSTAKEKALACLGNQALSLRLGSLYLLLAPMCGVETSTRAICAAAHRVSAGSPQLLEERSWPGFVEHLHTIVATLCGEPAAQLVRERALRLQQEAA
jgi:anti-sigma factor RsiW